MDHHMDIRLSIKVTEQQLLTLFVGIATLLLVIDSVAFQLRTQLPEKIHVLFDITLEGNIPTWYSVMQAFVVAIVCCFIMLHYRQHQQRLLFVSWALISLFFAYLSIDDASQFHERIATVWAANQRAELLDSFNSYHWQLLFLPVFIVFGIYMAIVFYREVSGRARGYLAAGLASFGLAVLLDYIDGVFSLYDSVMLRFNLSYDEIEHIARAAEEFIEMLGLAFFLTGFMLHLWRLRKAE